MKPADLNQLTREAKLQRLEAIKEKKRRQQKERQEYIPNEGQLQVHACDKRVRLVTAGNAGGKSCLAVHEALWAAQGYNPVLKTYSRVPVRIIIVLDRPSKVKDVWLTEMAKWIDLTKVEQKKLGHPHIEELGFPNGSTIKFLFHQTDPMAFESIEAQGLVVFDEPPPRAIWVALNRAGRTKKHVTKYLLIGTMIGSSWTRQMIWTPWSKGELPDTACFRFSTEVNRTNLAEGFIETFSRVLTEQERLARIEGLYSDLEGLALAHLFKRKSHIIPKDQFIWNQDYNCVVAIDCHPSKNNVVCLIGVDRDSKLYYIKEMSSASPPAQFARELREWMSGFRVVDIVCDSLGATPRSGGDQNLSFIDVLKKHGVRVRPTSFKEKNDEDWMARLQAVLEIPEQKDKLGNQIPQLRFVEGNNGVITEIENVAWTKYRNHDLYKPTLDISNKDYLATLKYALAANPLPGGIKHRVVKPKARSPWSGPKTK